MPEIRHRATQQVLHVVPGETLQDANLQDANLRDAHLRRADLRRANLRDAHLQGANLRDADLQGADLYGHHVVREVAVLRRADGYEFRAFETLGGLFIRAGCRAKMIEEFRAHVAKYYPKTAKAAETLAILDFCEQQAAREPWA